MQAKLEADDEALPSFGNSLSKYMSTPPTSSSRTTRLSARATRNAIVKTEYHDDSRKALSSPSSAASSSTLQISSSSISPTKRNSKSSASPKKRKKVYEEGAFEGMAEVPDRIAEDLNILFCGCNPGVRSSQEGYHYAHPSNRFYRVLHESGLTPHRLKPSESPEMPQKYGIGLTDLGRRCTARADQVPSIEFQAGAVAVLEKMARWRPKIVCFIGMDVYRNFRKHFPPHLAGIPAKPGKKGSKTMTAYDAAQDMSNNLSPSASPSKGKVKQSTSDVQLGLQKLVISVPAKDNSFRHLVRLFVIPSTSGLAAGYTDTDRIAYLSELKEVSDKLVQGSHVDAADASVLRAEDHMESRIVKLDTGQWVYVEKDGLKPAVIKKEEEL